MFPLADIVSRDAHVMFCSVACIVHMPQGNFGSVLAVFGSRVHWLAPNGPTTAAVLALDISHVPSTCCPWELIIRYAVPRKPIRPA
ncbi:MAG: hypothetical protein ABI877_15515 [Gemmatimonadaceae bacterium]